MSSALRIYYIHPLYLGPVTQWGPHLDRCTLQGFNAVLIAPPFKPGPNNDLFLTMDHRSVDPRIGRNNLPRFLSSFAKAARARDLLPMIDLVIDQVAIEALADPELAASYVEALTHDTPDPRLPPSKHGVAVLSPDANLSTLEKWWTERLRAWIDCGIGGFRCLHANRLPLPMLHGIIAAARRHEATTCFLASSCKDAEADPAFFKSAGFDLVTSGSYHWDFKNDWCLQEASGHDAPLPVITMPELPFGKRLAGDHTDDILAQRASVRALRFATETGQGWIMPMGYEFGLTSAMDPIRDCPSFFAGSVRSPRYDISPVISDINREMADRAPSRTVFSLRQITPAYAPVTVMLRTQQEPPITDIVVINPSLAHTASIATQTILAAAALPGTIISDPRNERSAEHTNNITLASGDVRTFRLLPAPSIKLPSPPARRNAQQAASSPRIAIENVKPSVDEGRFPVKRHVGDDLKVTADIFCDGHDQIAAALLWRPADQRDWNEERMHHEGNDIWSASFPLSRLGRHYFSIVAWKDEFANFSDELEKKHVAGLNVRLELEEGLQLLEATLRQQTGPSADMKALVQELRAGDDHQRLKIFLAPETRTIMQEADPRAFAVRHPVSFPVEVERRAAGFGSWYEIFPRSQSGDPTRHGTFDDVIARLPAIRDMGFDVLYFPPIHPIGTVNRKGRNNSTTAQPGDPGSPYAIGSAEGGHDALHPELGTLDDFSQLIREAERHGLEIALDFAIQCAPDHPWLQKHPGWFKWRPDGSMRYAENPPKKYEDIVNVDFYAEQAIPDLWLALRDVVLFWVRRGVRIFRVDNPHTKPFPFWEWMISDVRTRHPDVIFLSEAFTRPKVMYRLAKIGFSQSYTYFTWRNQKHELQEYLTELTTGPSKDYFRPHFFVNTPDINPIFLQNSGRAGFLIRAVLAGTLSGLFGVYNGFELCEARGIPGKEEYLDSEKYEIRSWDWGREGNIIQEVTLINKIRRSNPALQTHLNVRFHQASNENVLHYSKTTPDRYNLILTAVSLDPFSVQDSDIEIPLWTWDLPDDASIEVEDLMTGQHFIWHGKNQRVRLDPNTRPFFIWRLSPPEGSLS